MSPAVPLYGHIEVKGTELLNKKGCTEPSALLLASLPSPSKESNGLGSGKSSSVVSDGKQGPVLGQRAKGRARRAQVGCQNLTEPKGPNALQGSDPVSLRCRLGFADP